jgi:hypothetical protein
MIPDIIFLFQIILSGLMAVFKRIPGKNTPSISIAASMNLAFSQTEKMMAIWTSPRNSIHIRQRFSNEVSDIVTQYPLQ